MAERESGEGEGQPLLTRDVDADGRTAQGGIPHRPHRIAEGGEEDVPQNQDAADSGDDRQVVVRHAVARPRAGPDAKDAVVSSSHGVPLENDGPRDLREGHREHR